MILLLHKVPNFLCLFQSICKKLKRLLEPYEPQWCLEHGEWSLYLFAPHNR